MIVWTKIATGVIMKAGRFVVTSAIRVIVILSARTAATLALNTK